MKVTVNLPYAEYPVNAVKRVVGVPVGLVQKANGKVQAEIMEHTLQRVLESEQGQEMMAKAIITGLKNANLKLNQEEA